MCPQAPLAATCCQRPPSRLLSTSPRAAGCQEVVLHDMLTDAFRCTWTPAQQAMLGAVDGVRSLAEAQQAVLQLQQQWGELPAPGPARVLRPTGSAVASRQASTQVSRQPSIAVSRQASVAAAMLQPPPLSSARVSFSGASGEGAAGEAADACACHVQGQRMCVMLWPALAGATLRAEGQPGNSVPQQSAAAPCCTASRALDTLLQATSTKLHVMLPCRCHLSRAV